MDNCGTSVMNPFVLTQSGSCQLITGPETGIRKRVTRKADGKLTLLVLSLLLLLCPHILLLLLFTIIITIIITITTIIIIIIVVVIPWTPLGTELTLGEAWHEKLTRLVMNEFDVCSTLHALFQGTNNTQTKTNIINKKTKITKQQL